VGQVEHVLITVGQIQVIAGDAGHGAGGNAFETPNAVIFVDDVIAATQVAKRRQLGTHHQAPLGGGFAAFGEDLAVGEEGEFEIGQ